MKSALKAPGTKRMKLQCGELLSSFAFKFDLRRYNKGRPSDGATQLYVAAAYGRAVQVDPTKVTLKAHGTKRLKR